MKPSERINKILVEKGISPLDGEYKRFQAIVSYLDEQYEKEWNVKEPQWPSDKIVTGEYSYGAGYNQGRDDAIKAWKDAQGKQ